MVKKYGGLKRFIVDNLVTIATTAERLDGDGGTMSDDPTKLKAIRAIAKIVGLEDNPRITIIQNAIPIMSQQDLLNK